MNLLPIFVKMEGRRVLVVGAGVVALDKVTSLLRTGARITVVAPDGDRLRFARWRRRDGWSGCGASLRRQTWRGNRW